LQDNNDTILYQKLEIRHLKEQLYNIIEGKAIVSPKSLGAGIFAYLIIFNM
jgi:hypothetical protein